MKSGSFIQFRYILLLILLLGGFFRFTHVNWDSFGAYHPDERNISWAVTRIKFFSAMDPKFFAYGGLPIYLYRALGEGVVKITKDPNWLYDWGHIAVIGRYVSATLSTISIFLIFLVGSVFFNEVTGLASAAFLAFSPWAIQQAHFDTTETMLVFFILLLLVIAKKIQKDEKNTRSFYKNSDIYFLGIIWGLAMAAKTTALLFGVIPLVSFDKKIHKTFLVGITAALVFFCFSPYTLLDFQHFNESMTYESGVALGRFTVPYTLQFLHTTPYVYQLVTMLWQAGPLVIVGLAGLTVLIVEGIRKKQKEIFVLLIFPVVYFGWVGIWFAKFSRYNVPFLPFLTIAAAWFCFQWIKRFRLTGLAFTAIILSFSCLWGLANWTLYFRPQTKMDATQWILAHIPATAMIYTEHWNDGLPLDLPGNPSYHRELLTVYEEPDNDTKRVYYADKLFIGDYIILSTRRIWATMPRLTQKYPVTSLFYKKLLDGTLGFTEVAIFTSYPQLLGVNINDDTAEESIQVFDHPTVRIFQNTGHFSKEEIYKLLMSSMGS